MRHPTEGVLRRLLDEPAGVADADREHVAGCTRCLGEVAAMREDADLVGAALATDGSADVDVAAAWRRLSAATTSAAARAAPPRPSRTRTFLRRPAVAIVAVAVVLGGAGAAAASDWIQIFATEQVVPLSVSTADLIAMPDLGAYGDVALVGEVDPHEVTDAAAAAAETGLEVPTVTALPGGISGEPMIQVGSEVTATFTFSVDRARRSAAELDETLPTPPPGLDGTQVRLVAGPGVAQIWLSDAGAPALVVGRAVAPTAFSSGLPFETVRDYVLSLPGLPDDVAAQLRTFAADGSTLPLPIPADRVTTTTADVDGVTATVLTTRDRAVAAVVWVKDGVVTAVGGSLDADEVVAIARELR